MNYFMLIVVVVGQMRMCNGQKTDSDGQVKLMDIQKVWHLDSVTNGGKKKEFVDYYELFDKTGQYCHYLNKVEKNNCRCKAMVIQVYELKGNEIHFRDFYKKNGFYSEVDKVFKIITLTKDNLCYEDEIGNVWFFSAYDSLVEDK